MQTKQVIKKVIGEIVKFDQKIIVPADTIINLIDFYQEDRDNIKLSIGSNFKQVLNETTENGKHATIDISGEIISQYNNRYNIISDHDIMIDMQEPFLPMIDDAGRLEMRKRLAIVAYCMRQQPKGEKGVLLNNRYVTVIGYLLISFGSSWCANVSRGGYVWYCTAAGNIGHDLGAKHSFWSRNSPNSNAQ